MSPSPLGVALGIRHLDVASDQSTAWSLSKDAHKLETKISTSQIYVFLFQAGCLPEMGEYLDNVEANTRNHFIATLAPGMLKEMGFDDVGDLERCCMFAMKREKVLITTAIGQWGVKGWEVFPIVFARRVALIADAESGGLLTWRNTSEEAQNSCSSFEETALASDTSH